MKTALVTGSSGFLGQHFVRALEKVDIDVTGLDIASGDTTHFVIDVRSFMRRNTPDYDYIFHFAAPVGGREKIEGDPLYNAESLGIDAELFRWAVSSDHKPDIVYPSSSAVYGTVLQADKMASALSESMFHPKQSNWLAPDEMYGFTKMAGEFLAWKAASYGINTLCIRPFSGYGEGQSFEYPVPSIAARALRKEDPLVIWGSGDQTRDLIHVDDIVATTLLRLEYPLHGYYPLNLGSGRATSFREIAIVFSHLVGYDPAIMTDTLKPEGVKRRWADTTHQFPHRQPTVGLREGLARVLADVEQRLGVTA